MQIQIVHPPIADQTMTLDFGLITLTEALSKISHDSVRSGFLGGEFGYGAHWENDIFMMHPYCWCEEEDCPWCSGCKCVPPSEQYVDGIRVESWYEATVDSIPDYPHNVAEHGTEAYKKAEALFDKAIKARNARVTMIHPEVIHTCGHAWAVNQPRRDEFGVEQRAPNFWHKPSGTRVHWYKWIGRDMHAKIPDGTNISGIFNECLASLKSARTE